MDTTERIRAMLKQSASKAMICRSNYKDTKILEVFEGIPEWATPKMIERYEEFKAEQK